MELQELLEKQNFEVVQAKERISALAASVAELEEDLGTARKDLIKSEEMSSKYQRDLREVRYCPICQACCSCRDVHSSFHMLWAGKGL